MRGCGGGHVTSSVAPALDARRATKNPARHPARAAGVASVNTLFWKILVTRVKRKVGALDCGGFVAVVTGAKPGLECRNDFRERPDLQSLCRVRSGEARAANEGLNSPGAARDTA